jgi:carbon storage regulator CsrA
LAGKVPPTEAAVASMAKEGDLMLVLSRKLNEKIVVFDSAADREILSVTVVALANGSVRLGFETPGEKLPIFREEVLERSFSPASPAKPLAR